MVNFTWVPVASVFWRDMPEPLLVLEVISYVVVLFTAILTFKMLRDVSAFIEDDMIRRDLGFLLSSPLIVSITCIVGNSIPRSSELMYAIGLTYLMASLFRIVDLVYKLFGGRINFSEWLRRKGKKLNFAVTPFCCCCKCLPEAEPTPQNLLRLQHVVLQSPIVRIIIQVVVIILLLEKVPEDSAANQILNAVGVASAISGLYITHILLKMTQEYLEQFNMVVLFKCVDFGQLLFTLLKFNFDIAFKNWDIGYTDLMGSEANGMFFFNVAVIFGSLGLALLQFTKIRPGKCALFGTTIAGSRVSIRRRLRRVVQGGESEMAEEFRVVTPTTADGDFDIPAHSHRHLQNHTVL